MSEQTLSVLLIEDDPEFLEILEWEIKEQGHTPHIASTLNRADDILQKQKLDVILADYKLQGEKGLAILKNEVVKNHNIPVVLITGMDSTYDEKFFASGITDILRKPFDDDQLAKVLENIL